MAIEPLRPATLRIRLAIYGLIVLVIVVGMISSRPPSHLVVEVGPVGGSFYQTALQYQKLLAPRGIQVEIRPKANSLEILPDLANPASGVDVGFEAQDASEYADGRVYGAGAIQMQPLFVFASADLGRRITLTDLRGRRIVMPPAGSATSDAAVRVFQLYDLTPENTSFTFMPIADAVKELRSGHFDAGVFMLAPDNDLVRNLAHWSGVRLVSISEARAIANHLPFLRPIVLPRGIYDIADGIPPSDVSMLAGTVEVVMRPGLDPYVIYSLLEAMAAVHRGPTLISTAGTYPTITGSDLDVPPLVQEYYRSGMPWNYRALPPTLAGFIDRYLIYVIGLFVLAELYLFSHYLAEVSSALVSWRMARRPRNRGMPPVQGEPASPIDGS